MRVAVAVIRDDQQRLLITQRPVHASHGGYWEFPGGKLEHGELPEQALKREILEEVGLQIQESHYLGEITHQYTDKTVTLIIFLVTQFTGQAFCREGQMDLRWIEQGEWTHYQFPEANREIFTLIK